MTCPDIDADEVWRRWAGDPEAAVKPWRAAAAVGALGYRDRAEALVRELAGGA